MKSVLAVAALALVAGCAANEPVEVNERLDREYVTGSNIPKRTRPGEAEGVSTYDKEALQRARDAAVQTPRPGLGNTGP